MAHADWTRLWPRGSAASTRFHRGLSAMTTRAFPLPEPPGSHGHSVTKSGARRWRVRSRLCLATALGCLLSLCDDSTDINPVSVSIIYPSAGDTLTSATTDTIRWTQSGGTASPQRFDAICGSDTMHMAGAPVSWTDTVKYDWPIPYSFVGNDCRLELCWREHGNMFSEELCTSAGPFTIMLHEPFIRVAAGGSCSGRKAGDTCALRWESRGGDNRVVRIDLLDYGSRSFEQAIVDSTPDDGEHDWIVNALPGYHYVQFTRLSDTLSALSSIQIYP
jgi:hypothetical protein